MKDLRLKAREILSPKRLSMTLKTTTTTAIGISQQPIQTIFLIINAIKYYNQLKFLSFNCIKNNANLYFSDDGIFR